MNPVVIKCSLCEADTHFFTTYRNKDYHKCLNCHGIQMDPKHYLTAEKEKLVYETHNNDILDPRYQQFVSPIVNTVLNKYETNQKGLDFGCGTGPVISKLLMEQGYEMSLYDPFFYNYPTLLERKYDFIVSCEVVEHFHSPKKEFQLLKSLLNEQGSIIIMTLLVNETIDFNAWYYKNDFSHVFFYHPETFEWIKDHFGFRTVTISDRLIQLSL